jgi:hypothetical protein
MANRDKSGGFPSRSDVALKVLRTALRQAAHALVVAAAATTSCHAADASGGNADAHWVLDPQTHCYLFYADHNAVDSAAWSGACADRVAAGPGTAVFTQSGRFVESWSGIFGKGAAQDAIRVNWADGSHYEGGASAGRLNGHGVLTRRDGSKFEGEFTNGEPVIPPPPNAVLAVNSSASPTLKSAVAQLTAAAGGAPVPSAGSPDGDSTPASWLDSVLGQKFTAVDGSSIAVAASEGGITREIDPAAGVPQITAFTFLNAKQGTITDASAVDGIAGVFRISDRTVQIDYADGRSETLMANAAGGLSMAVVTAGGTPSCFAWYPAGHQFSTADREVALAAYANRLGLALPVKHTASTSSCMPAATQKTSSPARPDPTMGPAPLSLKPSGVKAAVLEPAAPAQPILVRTSAIHPIDNGTAAETSPQAGASINTGPESGCLSVEANGAEWGFRNHCGFAVQFAYCVLNGSDPGNSCDGGGVAGSVAQNGFDGLFAAKNFKNSDRNFRWIACGGGAGEIIPRLVRAEPPAGRCVRLQAS